MFANVCLILLGMLIYGCITAETTVLKIILKYSRELLELIYQRKFSLPSNKILILGK